MAIPSAALGAKLLKILQLSYLPLTTGSRLGGSMAMVARPVLLGNNRGGALSKGCWRRNLSMGNKEACNEQAVDE